MQFKKNENLRFTYRKNTQFTDVNNISEGYVFNNYNSIFRGNRQLEAAIVNSYNLNYRVLTNLLLQISSPIYPIPKEKTLFNHELQ